MSLLARRPRKRYIALAISLTIFLVAWITLLVTVGPESIVNYVGIENAYVVTFLLAATGGLSSFTAGPFYATLATFAAGGADPLWLGVLAGLGISIGDSLFFFLGRYGLTKTRLDESRFVIRLHTLLKRAPQLAVPFVTLVYTSISPFPNDVLMVTLGLLRQRYRLILPFLLIGNVTHTIIITTGASLVPDWLSF